MVIKMTDVLRESIRKLKEEDSPAAAEAKKRGLEYASFGRWKDPKTGKVVAKTGDGGSKLVDASSDDTGDSGDSGDSGAEESKPEIPNVKFSDSGVRIMQKYAKGNPEAEQYLDHAERLLRGRPSPGTLRQGERAMQKAYDILKNSAGKSAPKPETPIRTVHDFSRDVDDILNARRTIRDPEFHDVLDQIEDLASTANIGMTDAGNPRNQSIGRKAMQQADDLMAQAKKKWHL